MKNDGQTSVEGLLQLEAAGLRLHAAKLREQEAEFWKACVTACITGGGHWTTAVSHADAAVEAYKGRYCR